MSSSVPRSLNATVLGLAALGALAVAGCHKQSGEPAQPQASGSAAPGAAPVEGLSGAIDRSHKGSPIPSFALTDQAGKSAALTSFKGKPLLVNLWATWCAPCVAELPMLDKLATEKAGAIQVVTVSQDMSNPEKVAPFLATKAPHLEPWLDAKNDLSAKYEVSTLPTTIFYDAEGKEVWRFVGGHDWTSAETAKMLAEAK